MKDDKRGRHNPRRTRPSGTTANKNYSPVPVSDILASSLASLGIAEKIKEYRLKKAWPECVGEVIAKNSIPQNLIGKTLYCAVLSSTWMTELNYRREEIIKRLNQKMGEAVVSEIVFRIGCFKPTPSAQRDAPKEKKQLSAAEKEFIEKTVHPVKDDGLKAAIKKAMEEGV
ncbi:MAG: DUF721 domain-containing protein [Deltaproteobacteria bacterium]|nr:DUF721 domain-containing protein [Deltaproteobacteria bacterium]